jgi:SET domain-containing protein
LCIALSFASFRCIWATTKFKTKHPEVIDIIDNATREDDSKWTFNSGTRAAFIKTYEDSKSTRPAFLVLHSEKDSLARTPPVSSE